MVNQILFWTGFGVAVRFWQLGIEMRPFFHRNTLWVYPFFAAIGGSFGYWMESVSGRQMRVLNARKASLLDKRKRRAEREAQRGVDGQIDGAVHNISTETDGSQHSITGSA